MIVISTCFFGKLLAFSKLASDKFDPWFYSLNFFILFTCSTTDVSMYDVFSIRVKNSVDPYLMASSGMRRSRKFCQRESKFDNIFLILFLAEGIVGPNTTINGPLKMTLFL